VTFPFSKNNWKRLYTHDTCTRAVVSFRNRKFVLFGWNNRSIGLVFWDLHLTSFPCQYKYNVNVNVFLEMYDKNIIIIQTVLEWLRYFVFYYGKIRSHNCTYHACRDVFNYCWKMGISQHNFFIYRWIRNKISFILISLQKGIKILKK
jgi:hypothetical protein